MAFRPSRRNVLKAGAAAGVGLAAGGLPALPEGLLRALAAGPKAGKLQDVEHVVFLVQENRSFDHYFGTYPGVRGFDDRRWGSARFQQPYPGTGHPSTLAPFHLDKTTTASECTHDVHHQWVIQHDSYNNGQMDAWVRAHLAADGTSGGTDVGPMTMGYYNRNELPFYWALADHFTLCDAYHCSAISGTLANRLYSMTGTLDPDGKNGGPVLNTPEGSNQQDYTKLYGTLTWETMPERLEAAGISWKVYGPADTAAPILNDNVLLYFKNFMTNPTLAQKGYGSQDFPVEFVADCAAGNLPTVSWVITPFLDSEHPPTPLGWGQDDVHTVINALAGNAALWAKTVLFITWDENGGFFDHVTPHTPPPGTPGEFITVDDAALAAAGGGGIRGPIGLGFRVPMLIVSPFSQNPNPASGPLISSERFDHTSMLRFLETRFCVEVPNLSAWRRDAVGDLTSALNLVAVDPSLPALPATDKTSALQRPECITAVATEGPPGALPYAIPPNTTIPAQERVRGRVKRPRQPAGSLAVTCPSVPSPSPSPSPSTSPSPGAGNGSGGPTTGSINGTPITSALDATGLARAAAGAALGVSAWWAARRALAAIAQDPAEIS